MTEQLYRLPLSGDWLMASEISSVIMHRRYDNDEYVVIVTAGSLHYEIACPNLWVGEETRSEIACEANHAKLALEK